LLEDVQAIEPALRLGAFLGIFAVMAIWKILAPRRALSFSRGLRWTNNLGIVALNNGVPKEHFGLFLKECEWRFNISDPSDKLLQLKQWVRDYLR